MWCWKATGRIGTGGERDRRRAANLAGQPQEVQNRRGHKTDQKDAWWLAHLYCHKHDPAQSILVPAPVRQLRLLTRRRRELIRNAAQEKHRVQKLLEQSPSSCAA